MKTALTTALTVVLMTTTSLAAHAQDRRDQGDQGRRDQRQDAKPVPPPAAPQARTAPAPARQTFQAPPSVQARPQGGGMRDGETEPGRYPQRGQAGASTPRPETQAAPAFRGPDAAQRQAPGAPPPAFGGQRPGFDGGARPFDGRDGQRGQGFQGRDNRDPGGWDRRDGDHRDGDRRNGGQGFNGGRDYHPGFGAPGFRPGGERPRYSPDYYPRQIWARDRYEWRGGDWRGPRGFYYRRWSYGEYLPFGWFGAEWFINDYWNYELPVPPYGCEWIRSGPDALLVDQRTGFVVETVYGIFY